MKRFSFPLDRVLHWRKLEAERERAALQQLLVERERIQNQIAELRRNREDSRRSVAHARTLRAAEVATLHNWQTRVVRDIDQAIAGESKLTERIRLQHATLTEAERKVRLLEHLREKRLSEWKTEVAREEEAFAAEAFLARCIRERT